MFETERLVIRPLEKEDYITWLEGFENRAPSLSPYNMGKVDMSECTQEWFDYLVEKHQSLIDEDKIYIYAVFRKEDHKHVGMFDVSTLLRDNFNWGLVGYSIHNQYWRKGYALEALKKVLELAFKDLGFHRIEAHINLDNTASKRLAIRAGMKLECIRKAFIYENDTWTDQLIYIKNAS